MADVDLTWLDSTLKYITDRALKKVLVELATKINTKQDA